MSSVRKISMVARAATNASKIYIATSRIFTLPRLQTKSINLITSPWSRSNGVSNSLRFYSSKDFPSHNVIKMPALSPTMTQGNIGAWNKKVGDEITAGDVLVEIETDKAQMDFEFQEDGYIAQILVEAGSKDVPINQPLAILVENKEDVEKFANYTLADAEGSESPAPKEEPTLKPEETKAETPAQPETTSKSTQSSAPSTQAGRVFASPLAKKLAGEKGIDLSSVTPSGPNGRIIKSDIDNYKPSAGKPAPASAPKSTPATSSADYTDVPLTNIRKVIASRLTESKQQIPHYYLTSEANVDSLYKLRQHLNSQANDKLKLSVNDFVIKASALALRDVPEVNSAWHGDFIRQYHNADISIATATETGLITPIVTNVGSKGLSQISSQVKELAGRARSNELKPQEYQGGSFTISNLGMYGVNNFTAIINPPQSCILAVGGVQDRVVPDASEKGFKASKVLTVTLSCDHRVVDGAVGAQWLKAFKSYIENPLTMLL